MSFGLASNVMGDGKRAEFWLSATGIPLAVVNVLSSVIVGKLIAAS
jgi:hypothetical protein